MNGHVYSQLVMTCAGNMFLAGRDMTGFWPSDAAFTFTKLCEFRLPPTDEPSGDQDFPLLAADPMAWFESLKPWCRGLRLHQVSPTRAANQTLDTPDRMLAGLVGGGQRWLIEAVGEMDSEIWEAFQRVGDRSDPDRRIWLCTHIRQWVGPRREFDADVVKLDDALLGRMRAALVAIEIYARREGHDNFADIFRQSIVLLDERDVGPPAEVVQAARFTGFDGARINIQRAIASAWVFGGMGSWNDLGGGAEYDAVSQALYDSLNDGIAALANSTYRG